MTARPWEDRSEIVKELYSDLNVVRSPTGIKNQAAFLLEVGNSAFLGEAGYSVLKPPAALLVGGFWEL